MRLSKSARSEYFFRCFSTFLRLLSANIICLFIHNSEQEHLSNKFDELKSKLDADKDQVIDVVEKQGEAGRDQAAEFDKKRVAEHVELKGILTQAVELLASTKKDESDRPAFVQTHDDPSSSLFGGENGVPALVSTSGSAAGISRTSSAADTSLNTRRAEMERVKNLEKEKRRVEEELKDVSRQRDQYKHHLDQSNCEKKDLRKKIDIFTLPDKEAKFRKARPVQTPGSNRGEAAKQKYYKSRSNRLQNDDKDRRGSISGPPMVSKSLL